MRSGLSKVSVQTGTSHGGVPLPGGGVAEVNLDFGTLERLSAVCRSYGLAGAVQHGASTLPDELFHKFPEVETAEIDLATGFQNLVYDHPEFPRELRVDEAWCIDNAAESARRRDRHQFVYKTRKKALGPNKRALWELPTKDEILADQRASCVPVRAAPRRRDASDRRAIRDRAASVAAGAGRAAGRGSRDLALKAVGSVVAGVDAEGRHGSIRAPEIQSG